MIVDTGWAEGLPRREAAIDDRPHRFESTRWRSPPTPRAPPGQDLPVGRAKCLPQSRRLRLALDCPGFGSQTCIRASALDDGRTTTP